MDPGKYVATPLFNKIMLMDAIENEMHASITFILLLDATVFFSLR